MNTRHYFLPAIAATLLALSTTAALADDPTIDNTLFVSTQSRSEVKAELRQARKAHDLVAAGELGAIDDTHTSVQLARASVKAEVRLARVRGELAPAGEVDVASIKPTRRPLVITTLAQR